MSQRRTLTVDGNEAAASVAYRASEVIAIYPITPASPMGELADAWSVRKRPNLWGTVPQVMEMQSEGGAAGAVHGALQGGALTTTFTASQGLLLMIPNLYKIAGELTSFCMHVAARTVATHALSIFADHSDVMAVRQTGLALLVSNSPQEAHDLALIGHAATLNCRVPFLHFFDGFRTSHQIGKIEELGDSDLRAMIDQDRVAEHRGRGLTPDRPVVRGTAQNPDTFFQAREAANPFYLACPRTVAETMQRFARLTGRRYRLFDYVGHPEAERVVVLMGSGAEAAHETVDSLVARGERVGVVKVRLYRPFCASSLVAALPASVRRLAVLDRTKEPGAVGDPLYLDVEAALRQAWRSGNAPWQEEPWVVGGRYGLSSKEFDPASVKAVFDELDRTHPRHGFTIGIEDDVTHTSLEVDRDFSLDTVATDGVATDGVATDGVATDGASGRMQAVCYGLGSDGTVGANKSSIKILGEHTSCDVQGYFVYDSKKAGAVTISHLRAGPGPIRSTYLVQRAGLVACHQFSFLERYDVLACAAPGAVFLLNAPYPPEEVWDHLPRQVQEEILSKELRFYVIDAHRVARENHLGGRINTIMQTCFFAISGVLPLEEAVAHIKQSIEDTYGKWGPLVVRQNQESVDQALAHLSEVEVPTRATASRRRLAVVPDEAPEFVHRVTAALLAQRGDSLPVSAFPVDGTWPLGTSKWEKRNLAREIPIWDPALCIQCNQCALVCPHAAIRAKVYEEEDLVQAPEGFQSTDYRAPDLRGLRYSLQVAPEDCTGCRLCVEVCPAKDRMNPRFKAIRMEPQASHREREKENYRFFLELPEIERSRIQRLDAKGSQFLEPLFEYSGACAGCGETPYIKLLTQLFGDRLLVANATGCSSIYGGNLPTTPYTTNRDGRGPAWSNSLFEDNAEFGFGLRLAVDSQTRQARNLLADLAGALGEGWVEEVLAAEQHGEEAIHRQRQRIERLRARLAQLPDPEAAQLAALADFLVRKSVWLVGGDGWAYDIGYGGLDHVLALDSDVNILVLDTEVYSNTGGQQSKATPLGAAAKFASAGRDIAKKDLGLEAMTYGHVYVAQVAWGAKINHAVEVFLEADSYPGPSLIIAHSPCIAHGYDLAYGAQHQKLAVESGSWPLFRFDPRRVARGEAPLMLDSGPPKVKVADYMRQETRFRMVEKVDPERFKNFVAANESLAQQRFAVYQQLAGLRIPRPQRAAQADATPTDGVRQEES